MAKKKEKPRRYKCDLCGKVHNHLFVFGSCDGCESQLRKLFKYYKEIREKLES